MEHGLVGQRLAGGEKCGQYSWKRETYGQALRGSKQFSELSTSKDLVSSRFSVLSTSAVQKHKGHGWDIGRG